MAIKLCILPLSLSELSLFISRQIEKMKQVKAFRKKKYVIIKKSLICSFL